MRVFIGKSISILNALYYEWTIAMYMMHAISMLNYLYYANRYDKYDKHKKDIN